MIPIEWLRGLDEGRSGYDQLLSDAGGLAAAAWRLAKARCQVFQVSTEVPNRMELRAAARTIVRALGLGGVPDGARLALECEAQGLLVL